MRRDDPPAKPPSAAALKGTVPLPLAVGELDERDAQELNQLKELIRRRIGLHCGGYKEKCFRRRLAVRMRARGAHRYGEYATLLEADPDEYRRLLETVTINVSKFFRNPEVWEHVSNEVLPALFASGDPEIRIWSAGCAGGEEPYTLAILLHEYAAQHGHLSRLGRFRILATDVDADALAAAKRAVYLPFAMTDTSPERLARWFEGTSTYAPVPGVRAMVEFGEGDLMNGFTPSDLHWIVCRNVIIYFERQVQEELFLRFRDALRPRGFLTLGKVEALAGPAASEFRVIRNRERIFQKV